MNREQLKTLINEAIKEVLSEKTPKGFNPKLKKQIKSLIQSVYSDVFNKNEHFKFYLTKNGNTRVIKTKTQIV